MTRRVNSNEALFSPPQKFSSSEASFPKEKTSEEKSARASRDRENFFATRDPCMAYFIKSLSVTRHCLPTWGLTRAKHARVYSSVISRTFSTADEDLDVNDLIARGGLENIIRFPRDSRASFGIDEL